MAAASSVLLITVQISLKVLFTQMQGQYTQFWILYRLSASDWQGGNYLEGKAVMD